MLEEKIIEFITEQPMKVIIPITVFCITMLVGYFTDSFLFKRLTRWAKKTPTNIDDIIVEGLRQPFLVLCGLIGVYVALEVSELPDSIVRFLHKVMIVLGILWITMVIAHLVVELLTLFAPSREDKTPGVTSLTQNAARIIIFAFGTLIVLHMLGISITPFLATLGVGGLAVALALQDTLANFFAGFYIIFTGQIKIGNYIKLDSGEEGYVTDINWRITKIRKLANNVIIVPNDRLAKTILTNYYGPDKELAVLLQVGVHYNSDLKKVEKITCAVGKEIMEKVKGGVPLFNPFIRYHTFGDSSINFTVILRAKEFVDQYLIKHEFVKLLHEQYAKEGIVIPYPIRAINYDQEKGTD